MIANKKGLDEIGTASTPKRNMFLRQFLLENVVDYRPRKVLVGVQCPSPGIYVNLAPLD